VGLLRWGRTQVVEGGAEQQDRKGAPCLRRKRSLPFAYGWWFCGAAVSSFVVAALPPPAGGPWLRVWPVHDVPASGLVRFASCGATHMPAQTASGVQNTAEQGGTIAGLTRRSAISGDSRSTRTERKKHRFPGKLARHACSGPSIRFGPAVRIRHSRRPTRTEASCGGDLHREPVSGGKTRPVFSYEQRKRRR
jgi:hypothetical protein